MPSKDWIQQGIVMSELFDKRRHPDSAAPAGERDSWLLPIDEAVAQHVSQLYWDWLKAFDQDPCASPLQHPDFVLAELADSRVVSHLGPMIVMESSDREHDSMGVLLPKTIRTSKVGGVGPGWTLHGLRLAGGRFLGKHTSREQQSRLLQQASAHAATVGADFLLIEDLEINSELHFAVQKHQAEGGRLFATHDFQPRRFIDFPKSAADYWKTFSSRSLSKFRRNLKKFGKTRLERVTQVTQIPDFLRAAHEISLESWQSRQFGLRIRNDDAEMRQLSVLAQHGMLRSYLWWIEDQPAAFAVCNQHRGCFRYEEIAFRAEYGQFSPGRTMLQQIVDDLFQHDPPDSLDFGGGDAEYKQQFSNRESSSGTVWLVPATWRAGLALTYLKACRRVRTSARRMIETSGLRTRLRQWLRSRGASSSGPQVTPETTTDTDS